MPDYLFSIVEQEYLFLLDFITEAEQKLVHHK